MVASSIASRTHAAPRNRRDDNGDWFEE